MTCIDELSDEAQLVYQAFLDMSASKSAHFSCLEAIESTYEAGGVPSLAEKLELEKLLENHDKNVLAFSHRAGGAHRRRGKAGGNRVDVLRPRHCVSRRTVRE